MAKRKKFRPTVEQLFICVPGADAQAVYLAGDFNNWDAAALPMTRNGVGFEAKLALAPGRPYEYKFVVDGAWVADPGAPEQVPNAFCTTNSVVRV